MKRTGLILIALALFAGFVVWVSRPDKPAISHGPSFEVTIIRPFLGRPLFGLIPSEQRFDQASPGATIGSVGSDRLELRADLWDLVIVTDDRGDVAAGTRLVYPMDLAEPQRRVRCRLADRPVGYLTATTRPGSGELDGRFLVKLTICENAKTGGIIEWPPAPLTVRGTFEGLSPGGR